MRRTVDGGDWPTWRSDGEEIYYVDSVGQVIAVPVGWRNESYERVPEFGVPQVLFRAEFKDHADRQYDTLDGETFLLSRIVLEGARDPPTLVQNWNRGLRP